jgi:ketosteroid isomerase-like protein
MGIVHTTMTDEQRKSVALEYLKSLDRGSTSDERPFLELFAEDAVVYFPKWGVAHGRSEIGKLFGDVGATFKSIRHHSQDFNYIFSGSDTIVIEGRSSGEHRDGPWEADHPGWGAGRWCDVFEIRDFLIQRVSIYLDPDYAGKDTTRYPWISA